MTMPSREVQRSRQTAMEAERHWYTMKMLALAGAWRVRARDARNDGDVELACAYESCAVDLGHLIAERTK